MGNGALSSKINAPKQLKALEIDPDESMDLSALIEAYMPGIIDRLVRYISAWATIFRLHGLLCCVRHIIACTRF